MLQLKNLLAIFVTSRDVIWKYWIPAYNVIVSICTKALLSIGFYIIEFGLQQVLKHLTIPLRQITHPKIHFWEEAKQSFCADLQSSACTL